MTANLPQWRKTGSPKKGQALTDIGKPIRSINRAPGHPTGPLPGSRTLPAKTKRVGPAPPPVITIQKAPVDALRIVALTIDAILTQLRRRPAHARVVRAWQRPTDRA